MTDRAYCEMNNIRTVVDPSLPYSVRAFVWHDKNGDFCIVINGKLFRDAQRLEFKHELNHILSDHLDDPDYHEYAD